MADQTDADDPMRERILRATFKVLCRHGYGKFNLSDVAAQAGISRPTLYKSFSSKDELLAAFSEFELQLVRDDLARAVDGRKGRGGSTRCCSSSRTSTAPTRCAASSRSSLAWCSLRWATRCPRWAS